MPKLVICPNCRTVFETTAQDAQNAPQHAQQLCRACARRAVKLLAQHERERVARFARACSECVSRDEAGEVLGSGF